MGVPLRGGVQVTGLAYRSSGTGAPVVFLHGNPTSSYLWRNVLPHLPGWRLAPDLIGMGDSPRPDIAYTFEDHVGYLDAWFDALSLDDVTLIAHDWGGALAADWASRHPARVRALAFTEAVLKPMTWEEFPPRARRCSARSRVRASSRPGSWPPSHRSTRRRSAAPCCSGPVRCRWVARRLRWWRGSRRSAAGWGRRRRCRSCW
ncbi:alpha/beta fold hydrolase [Amycolatopsis sp. cmx-4-61]|uniref:alpha/beta fold hydrolase n=1 Tax=Amycolatopsis sp. cmx-4-61 TaxID=2790937 RepID=UPI00397C40AF